MGSTPSLQEMNIELRRSSRVKRKIILKVDLSNDEVSKREGNKLELKKPKVEIDDMS